MAAPVRIQPESHSALKEMATAARVSRSELLAEAIDLLNRKRFFDQCDAAYARLRADPEAWSDELAERAEWDSTLGDGLQDL